MIFNTIEECFQYNKGDVITIRAEEPEAPQTISQHELQIKRHQSTRDGLIVFE